MLRVLSCLRAYALVVRGIRSHYHPAAAAAQAQASSYLLIDSQTQTVLAEHNAQERNAPASLTKIMTGYVVEEEIRRGRLGVDESVPISVNAWRTGGSKMFIREGTGVSVSTCSRA